MKKALAIYMLMVAGLFSLLSLRSVTVSAQNLDPTLPGPLLFTREEYNLGDQVFTPTDFPLNSVELRGSVHYPTNWVGGPLPLIVFLHGQHETCYQGTSVAMTWPCTDGKQPIPSFKGFDYIAEVLASNGYFVVSISANGITANDDKLMTLSDMGSKGARARAELIQKHLELWNMFNTTGGEPFGTKFIGKIDMQRIGTMGQSRGGEGVVRQFMLNEEKHSPYGIKAVFALAPSNLNRFVINKVPLAVLLPYCDGDAATLGGVHFYDDARYNVGGDLSPKHTILVIGANHNFYNKMWTPLFFQAGARDDFDFAEPFCQSHGSGRLTESQQLATGLMYVSAFFRVYVGGELQFLPLLTGASSPLPSAGTNKIYVSFHAPDSSASRRDINRVLDPNALFANWLGGTVAPNALWPYDTCGGDLPEPDKCLTDNASRQPHTHRVLTTHKGLSQLRMGWADASATLTNNLPAGQRDVTSFQALQFRASVNYKDDHLMAAVKNFKVELQDGTGATASIRVADFSQALFFPPGAIDSNTPVPKVVLNTVRLPLSAFPKINLADIRSVSFLFDQQSQGALLITDIAFVSAAHITLPVFSIDACMKDDSSGAELVFNTASGNYVFCYGAGLTMSGVGKVVVHGGLVSLTQGTYETDRRLVVTLDRGAGRGVASLQTPAGTTICTITDRNIANSTCSCAPAP